MEFFCFPCAHANSDGDSDSYADGLFQSNRYPGAKPDSNTNCNTYCYSNAASYTDPATPPNSSTAPDAAMKDTVSVIRDG